MPTIEQLREQRASIWDQMEAVMARAESEDRDLTDEERTQYDALEVQFNSAGSAVAHAEKREQHRAAARTVERPNASTSAPVMSSENPAQRGGRTLGEHFAAEAGERIKGARAEGSRFTVSATEFRNAATDTQVTGGTGGSLSSVLTQVDTNVVPGFRRRLTVADLLSTGTLTGQAITYFVEGALEGAFTTVGENGQKPQIHFANPTAVTEALTKIAGFIKESDEMVEDLPFLVSAINNRLLYELGLIEENQILSGAGTGTNLTGLLNRSGVQTKGSALDPAAGNPDLLFESITAVSTATGLDADGLIINPADYQTLRLMKDANDQYFGGGFFTGPYGNNGIVEQPPLWGLRTVVTPAISAGTVLVGAFQAAATLYRKGGVRVEATNSNEDDFTNNRVTVRAEERIALAVRRPSALVEVTLGAA